jgi:hypothetical protein
MFANLDPGKLSLMTAANAANGPTKPLILLDGAPEGIRTLDLCLRRASLQASSAERTTVSYGWFLGQFLGRKFYGIS